MPIQRRVRSCDAIDRGASTMHRFPTRLGSGHRARRPGPARLPDGHVRCAGVVDADSATISRTAHAPSWSGREAVRLLDLDLEVLSVIRTPVRSPRRSPRQPPRGHGRRRSRLLVWSGQSGRRIHSLIGQFGHPTEIAFSPDGTLVASASSDGIARVWRTSDWGAPVGPPGSAGADGIAFSADSEHVVTSGRGRHCPRLRCENRPSQLARDGHDDWVTSAAFTGGVGSCRDVEPGRHRRALGRRLPARARGARRRRSPRRIGGVRRRRAPAGRDDRQTHTCARSQDGRN